MCIYAHARVSHTPAYLYSHSVGLSHYSSLDVVFLLKTVGGLVTSVQWKDKPNFVSKITPMDPLFDQQSKQHVIKIRRLLDDLLQKGDLFNRFG